MYAVVSSGGKQYRVEPGTTLIVERLADDVGATVTFDRVLMVGDGETVTVGTPVVGGASVRGTVLGPESGPKIVVFKFKQKVKYRRRTGHRQQLTRVRIDEITADGKTVKADAPAATTKARRTASPDAAPKRSSKASTPAKRAGGSAKKADAAEGKPKRRSTRAAAGDSAGTEDGAAKTPSRRRASKAAETKE